MNQLASVTEYIELNILHSKLFDTASPDNKLKAINQAVNTLIRHLDVYVSKESIPVEDVAEQVMWLFKMDDTMQRAELGTTSISVDGVSVSFTEMDRTIAPNVLNIYGIRSTKRRRVGSYEVPVRDTMRVGQQLPPSFYNRRFF